MNENIVLLINRNIKMLELIPEKSSADYKRCLKHIMWANDLNERLYKLDYDQKEINIENIITKLEADYDFMCSFKIENKVK